MNDLPPELEPRRDALFERVTRRGRTLRRRRIAAISTAVTAILLVPLTTVAIVRADDDPPRVAANPSVPDTTTTTVVCRNSTNPSCGPMFYDPPITNAPATITVSTSPPVPRVGDVVTFTVHVADPDTPISESPCVEYTFGERAEVGGTCAAHCPAIPVRYGAWEPPPARPGDSTFKMEHVYATAGIFEAKFEVTVGMCNPRASSATADVPMEIAA
jgi:hypothetical protein